MSEDIDETLHRTRARIVVTERIMGLPTSTNANIVWPAPSWKNCFAHSLVTDIWTTSSLLGSSSNFGASAVEVVFSSGLQFRFSALPGPGWIYLWELGAGLAVGRLAIAK